jgi:transcription elongation factor Elf1
METKTLRAGVAAGIEGYKEGSSYSVAGHPVKCPLCGHEKFLSGRALLNSRGRTLLNLDWTNSSATTLVCAECGRIEWFAQQPDLTDG